jgi:hypothetical protein
MLKLTKFCNPPFPPKPKTFCLASFLAKLKIDVLSLPNNHGRERSHFSSKTKKVLVELWLAKVSFKQIRNQLQMLKATLMLSLPHDR